MDGRELRATLFPILRRGAIGYAYENVYATALACVASERRV